MNRNRIVVIGGGIAGVETALTLARTSLRAHITLVTQWPSLRVNPRLVYLPLGAEANGLEVRLDRVLAPEGIELITATCDHVDRARRRVALSTGQGLEYDTLVVAPGTIAEPTHEHRLRTLDDATRLRQSLTDLALSTHDGRSIDLRVPASCTWAPPAFEFALLLAQWRDERGLDDVRIVLAIEDIDPLAAIDLDAGAIVREELRRAGVDLLTHVSAASMDVVPSNVAIEFGGLRARRIPGLPPVNADGFYDVDATGRVAPDVYVVGDAAATDYKAAFATGWQARRIASALGGDIALLGAMIAGVPVEQAEYQMDLGHETLIVRFAAPSADLRAHDLMPREVQRVAQAPDKLTGLLTHALLQPHGSRAIAAAAATVLADRMPRQTAS